MSPTDPGPVLEMSGLSAAIGGRIILDGVSARLFRGRWYGLVGQNGCGKTTLMRVALGLLRPRAGTVRLLGAGLPAQSGAVGVCFGPRGFHPHRRVRTEVRLRVWGLGGDDQAADAAWAETGLRDPRVRCGDLSLGQAQRLSVVCALAMSPPLVVLDEPTTGLDAHAVPWLRERLAAYVADGGCLWVSSHDLAEVERSADQILVLHQGGVAYDGPVSGLAGPPEVHVRSSEPELLAKTLEAAGVEYRADGDGAVLSGRGAAEIGRLLADRCVPLTHMSEHVLGLDGSLRALLGEP
jgi:ABC-2 type transport system ATP-binding protein